MRNAVFTLVALLAATPAVHAQAREWADKLFKETAHNFGNVPHGAVLSYRFPMTNIYAVPLEITGTRVSCGCTTVKPSAQVLQPKETAFIDVTMDARRFTGPKTVSIYVSVGPNYTSTATLQISANSRSDVVFNPGSVNFGVVASGQGPTQIIDVEYAGNLDWRINGVAEQNAPLSVKTEELYRQPGPITKVGYRLHVSLKSTASAGTFRWELLLQTNDRESPTVPVLVEANIQAALSVVPSPVTLGTTTPGQEIVRKVFVRGSKPFRILGVDGQADGLTVELPQGVGDVQIVTIKWRPSTPGDLKRELRFKTDLDGGASAVVSVDGKAGP